jgi:HAD superfamily hydrolase (TIGR01549 family)
MRKRRTPNVVRGVIFDLDGTLIDSRLDFGAMRRDMGFPHGQPILEGIEALPTSDRREQCLAILRDHERRGAESATLMPGACELLAELDHQRLPTAILTRNARAMTDLTLARLGLRFSQVLTREDAPPKPDPGGLLHICRVWNLPVTEVLFVGDFRFDVLAGQAAGIATLLYAPDGPPDYSHEADFVIAHLREVLQFTRHAGASAEREW